MADFIAENVQPLVLQPLRSPSFQLIGLGLGPEGHQQVAVVDGSQSLPHEFQIHGHTAVLFQTGKIQAENGNISITGFFQRLS